MFNYRKILITGSAGFIGSNLTLRLLDSSSPLTVVGLETDTKFYEHLLRMVVLSYQRTTNVPEQIKKSLFALFGEMLRSERKDDFRVSKRYVNLEKAILNKEYGRYCFLSKFL